MKETLKKIVNIKYFHICMIFTIIVIILFTLGMICLKYNVEGETNMPFRLSKITVISSLEGIDKENLENKWAFDVNQNNDVFLYIEKNKKNKKEEAIKTIKIENFNITKEMEKGEAKLFKPSPSENSIFNCNEENKIDKIEYTGDMDSNIQQLKIANQGGVIAFRYSNCKIAEYLSNEEEIHFNNLLKNTNINQDDLKSKVNFDVIIDVESGKQYKANIELDFPVGNVVEEGTTSTEITDLSNIIFKRLKN